MEKEKMSKQYILEHNDNGYFLSFIHQGQIRFWTDDKEKAHKFVSRDDAIDYDHDYLNGECKAVKLKEDG